MEDNKGEYLFNSGLGEISKRDNTNHKRKDKFGYNKSTSVHQKM